MLPVECQPLFEMPARLLVVTEFGVAELRGRSLSERARALTAIADPRFREQLKAAADRLY